LYDKQGRLEKIMDGYTNIKEKESSIEKLLNT